jgi:predicted phosphoadenosine phosphosulfate sulfurtransferase
LTNSNRKFTPKNDSKSNQLSYTQTLTFFDIREEIALSFNGGKDCTVALHLLDVVCQYRQGENVFKKIKFVHFVKDGEF